jgi:hypothetical protein
MEKTGSKNMAKYSKPIIFLLASGDTSSLRSLLSAEFNDSEIRSYATAEEAVRDLDALPSSQHRSFEAVVVEQGLPSQALLSKAREMKGDYMSSYVYAAAGIFHPELVPPQTDAVLSLGVQGITVRPIRTAEYDAFLVPFPSQGAPS